MLYIKRRETSNLRMKKRTFLQTPTVRQTHSRAMPDSSQSIDDESNCTHFTIVRKGYIKNSSTLTDIHSYANPVFLTV